MSSVIMGAEILQPPTGGAPVQGAGKFSQYIGFGDSALDSGYNETQPSHFTEPLYEAAALAGGSQVCHCRQCYPFQL